MHLPFANVTPQSCLIVTRDLDIIQQALTTTNDLNEKAPNLFTPYLTKKQEKQLTKLNSYNTRSKGEAKDC